MKSTSRKSWGCGFVTQYYTLQHSWTYSSLFVSLLHCVTCDFCVSVVLGCGPLKSNIEAPGVDDLHTGRRSRQLCKHTQSLTIAPHASSHLMHKMNRLLTNDLQDDWSLVLEVLHLHTHLVHSRVISLRGTDEQDAVPLCAADVDPLCVQGLSVLCPCDHRFGFTLERGGGRIFQTALCRLIHRSNKLQSCSAYCEGDGQVDLVSNVSNVSLLENTRQADLGTVWRENHRMR